jgi:EmrB/QacA subfamily drug resistance transporter
VTSADGAGLAGSTGTQPVTPSTPASQAAPATSSAASGRGLAHPGIVLAVIAGAQLMVVLDATIVNIALPSMGHYFHRNQTDMTWVLNAYTLAFGGFLLLGGRSGDIFGRRRMFVIGLALFTLGSFAAGLSTDFTFLLSGRIVQGLGGAIASPTALSLITTEFKEGHERNRAIGIYAAVSGGGAALGLLLGGILTNYLTWRWVLFVNVPIGVVIIAGALLFLGDSERLKGRIDYVGALLSVAGMTALVYGFIHVAHTSWGNTETFVVFIAAIVLLVGFVLFELYGTSDPIMPLRIFANRSRSGAYLVMLIVGAALFGMFYFITFFVQGVLGYSALKAGFAFLPVAVLIGISSQINSVLLPRVGPKPLIAIGTVLTTVALLWLSTVGPNSGYLDKLLPGMVVMAIGLGFIFVPITTVAISKVVDTDAGLASAVLNVGQQVGGSIGLSVLATTAATAAKSATTSQTHKLITQYGSASEHLKNFGELGQSYQTGAVPSRGALADSIARHAIDTVQAHSAGIGFLTGAIFGGVAIVVAILMINVKKSDMPTGHEETDAAAAAAA